MGLIDFAVLALYPPIIFFALWAVWLYGGHVIWPAVREGMLNVRDHALPIALVLTASADLVENTFYGYARIDKEGYNHLTTVLPFIGPMKIVILIGTMFAIAGYQKAVYGATRMAQLITLAWCMWCTSFLVLVLFFA